MNNNVFNNLTITSTITDKWYSLDADIRAQHILSNSDLYQQIKLMEQTLQEFRRLEEQQNAASK